MKNRKELLTALEELSAIYPDWRLGQLICNAAYWAKGPKAEAVWDVEDEALLEAIREHLRTREEITHQSHGL